MSLSRAIGETAPLIVIGIPALLIPFPEVFLINLLSYRCKFIIGRLDSSLVEEYAYLASATIIVLLVLFFIIKFNGYFYSK